MRKLFIAGVLLCLVLVACGKAKKPTETPTSPAPTNTAVRPSQTAVIPSAPTSTPTPTRVPPTGTSSPTSLPPTSTPTGTPSPIPSSTPTAVIIGPNNFLPGINPLTGLAVADVALLERHPIAIKVAYYLRNVRPIWGVSLADIVFDYRSDDGGDGRLHAIFYGTDADYVGPVRSARLLDRDLIPMYKSIFAYGNASYQINNRLFATDFANRLIVEGETTKCPPTVAIPMCRYEPSGGELLLASTKALTEFITKKGVEKARQNLDGMLFNPVAAVGGTSGTQVYARFSTNSYNRWDYDATSGRYLRFQDEVIDQGQGEKYAPMMDRQTNQQMSAANVVILLIRYDYYDRTAGILDILISAGQGKAYAFRDGQMYEVLWNRPTSNSVLYLTFPDGSLYPYKPGNTWYEIVGETSQITQKDTGVWRFEYRMP